MDHVSEVTFSFKWVEKTSQFNDNFINGSNDDSHEGYFHEVDVQCPENLYNLHNEIPFLPERMKIEKLMANLHVKKESVIRIRNLKQALKHGLVL